MALLAAARPRLAALAARHRVAAYGTAAFTTEVGPDPNKITPGPTSRCRLLHHYRAVVSHDLLYMTYSLPLGHALDGSTSLLECNGRNLHGASQPEPESKLPTWDPDDPYTKNRPRRPPRGGSFALTPKSPNHSGPEHLPTLLKIVIDIHVPSAVANRKDLLGPILLLKLITGEPDRSALPFNVLETLPKDKGIRICKTRNGSVSFRLRRNMPCGVSVTVKGPQMYSFIDTLTSIVLPRLKDFNGFKLPNSDAHMRSVSMNGGVINVGLGSDSMSLWPGVEESLESWPGKRYGLNIHFVTSARGSAAQHRARALMSGFRIPFVRPADA